MKNSFDSDSQLVSNLYSKTSQTDLFKLLCTAEVELWSLNVVAVYDVGSSVDENMLAIVLVSMFGITGCSVDMSGKNGF